MTQPERSESRAQLRDGIKRLVMNRLFQFEDDFAPDAHERISSQMADEVMLIIDRCLDGYKEGPQRPPAPGAERAARDYASGRRAVR